MLTHAEALERALQFHEAGRLDEAEKAYRAILAREPRHAEALHLLGVARHQQGAHESAIRLIGKAITIEGASARFHNSLGIAYRAAGHFDEADASYRTALALDPNFAEAASNLGNVLHQRGNLADAIDCYRRALAIDARRAEFHNNLGTALFDQGDADTAETSFRRALFLNPQYPDAHFHLGLALLQRGAYAEGWREYEWRWSMASFVSPRREFKRPQWRGEPLGGADILIHVEQGFGDVLQFVRYVPLVAERAGKVLLETPKALMRLLTGIDGVAELVPYGQRPSNDFAWHCPIMSLPLAIGTELGTIPATVPYLGVDDLIAGHWRERIGKTPGIKVGCVLASGRVWKAHYQRSLPTTKLFELAGGSGIALFSLQKENPIGSANPYGVIDLAPDLTDFADTAAAIMALDLVVTVDTSVAHLAGALGKPVWIMLPHVADWRWLTARNDSPWYPSARLFRQMTPGDWTPVVAEVVDELRRFATD